MTIAAKPRRVMISLVTVFEAIKRVQRLLKLGVQKLIEIEGESRGKRDFFSFWVFDGCS